MSQISELAVMGREKGLKFEYIPTQAATIFQVTKQQLWGMRRPEKRIRSFVNEWSCFGCKNSSRWDSTRPLTGRVFAADAEPTDRSMSGR